MSEESLKRPPYRPSLATLEEKGAVYGVLSLYPRRSREYRQKRAEFAERHNVHPRTIDNWFDEMLARHEGSAA